MDEKARLSQKLNSALANQIAKRESAGSPEYAKAQAHLTVVAKTEVFDANDFFDMWAKYYPIIVSLLGWASWILPGKTVNVIKALLAVVNNNVIPILKDLMNKP